MPVTIPGSAIGRMISRDTALRPKKRCRDNAIAAMVPSTRETTVAKVATRTLTHRASRAPCDEKARCHQSRVRPAGGHANERLVLKEFSTTSARGT